MAISTVAAASVSILMAVEDHNLAARDVHDHRQHHDHHQQLLALTAPHCGYIVKGWSFMVTGAWRLLAAMM